MMTRLLYPDVVPDPNRAAFGKPVLIYEIVEVSVHDDGERPDLDVVSNSNLCM